MSERLALRALEVIQNDGRGGKEEQIVETERHFTPIGGLKRDPLRDQVQYDDHTPDQ